jgi:hypothetical protein
MRIGQDLTGFGKKQRRQRATFLAGQQNLSGLSIERIERLNPTINAVVTPMYEHARATATGELPCGQFTGVPFTRSAPTRGGFASLSLSARSPAPLFTPTASPPCATRPRCALTWVTTSSRRPRPSTPRALAEINRSTPNALLAPILSFRLGDQESRASDRAPMGGSVA